MKKAVMALAILGLVLVLGTRAEALVTTCSGTGQHIVNTVVLAQALAAGNGYANEQCELIIQTSIPGINIQQFILKSRGLTIDGPDVVNAGPVNIINPLPSGEIDLLSEGGQDIRIDNAVIHARGVIKTVCSGGVCKIKVDQSSIVAANPLGDTTSQTGELFFSARGDIDINTSTIYGGAGLHIGSDTGHVVFICLPGPNGTCKDPLTSGVQQQLCPPTAQNPTGFPCPVTFASPEALHAVCFPGGGQPPVCGGGSKEIRIVAFLFVDITGSTFIVLDHISIESVTQDVRAADSTIVALDAINVSAKTTINMKNATWIVTAGRINVQANCVGSPAPAICINANEADLKATDVIGINANNAAGVVTVCDLASLDVPGSNVVVLNGGVCNFPPSGAGPNSKVTAAECVAPFGGQPALLCK